MTEADVITQLLDGAPPGTVVYCDRCTMRMERTFVARVNGASVKLAVLDDRWAVISGLGLASRAYSVDWPAVLLAVDRAIKGEVAP